MTVTTCSLPILKGGHHHHRPKGLLLGRKGVVFHISENSGLKEKASSVHTMPSTHKLRAFLHTSCNIVQQTIQVSSGGGWGVQGRDVSTKPKRLLTTYSMSDERKQNTKHVTNVQS